MPIEVAQYSQKALSDYKDYCRDFELKNFEITTPVVTPKSVVQGRLPLWPEGVRAIPNEIVRSALFNAKNKKSERTHLKNATVCVIGDGEIFYTGEELRQDDETVWMQVLHLSRLQVLETRVVFVRAAFLREIKWPTNEPSYRRLDACLDRLSATNLTITSKRLGRSVGVSLIRRFDLDEISGMMIVELEPEIRALFDENNYTLSEWQQRLALPHGVATWLHAYFSSHADPYPLKLKTIADGAGVKFSRTNDLLRTVEQALTRLCDVKFLAKYEIRDGADGPLILVERAAKAKRRRQPPPTE